MSNAKRRQPGFYWVRFKRVIPGLPLDPEIAFWGSDGWRLSGADEGADDEELEVLSERLRPPESEF